MMAGRKLWLVALVAMMSFGAGEAKRFKHGRGKMEGATEAREDDSDMLRRIEYSAELLKPVLIWAEMMEEGVTMSQCEDDGLMSFAGTDLEKTDYRNGNVIVFDRAQYLDALGCPPPVGLAEGEADDPQVFAQITTVLVSETNKVEVMTKIVSGSVVVPHIHFSIGKPYKNGDISDSVREVVALDNTVERIWKRFKGEPIDGLEVGLRIGIDADVGNFDFFRDGFNFGIKFEIGAEITAQLDFTINVLSKKFVEYNNTIVEFPIPSLGTPRITFSTFLFSVSFGAGFYGELNLIADLELKIRTMIKYKASFTARYEFILYSFGLVPVDVNVVENPTFDFGEDNGIVNPDDYQIVGAKLTGFLGVRPALEAQISFLGTLDADIGAEFGAKAVVEFQDPPFEEEEDTGPIVFGDCRNCHHIEGRLQLVGQKLSFQSEVFNYEKTFLDGLFDINIGTACFWNVLCPGVCPGRCLLPLVCSAEQGTITTFEGCDGSLGCCENSQRVGCILPGGQNGVCLPERVCDSVGQSGVSGFCPGNKVCCVAVGDELVETCELDDGREGRCIRTATCSAGGKDAVGGVCSDSGLKCCVEPFDRCTVADGRVGTCEPYRSCTGRGQLSIVGACDSQRPDYGCCLDRFQAPPTTDCSVGDGREGNCISPGECDALEKESVSGFCTGGADILCCVEPNPPEDCTTVDGREGTCISTVDCAASGNESVPELCSGAAGIQCCVEPSEPDDCMTGDGRNGTCIPTGDCSAAGKESVPNFCPGGVDIQCCVEPSEPTECMTGDGRNGTCIPTGDCASTGKESVPDFCPGGVDIQCCVEPSQPGECITGDGRNGTCIPTGDCASAGKESVPDFCPGGVDIQCCVDPAPSDAPTCTIPSDGREGFCIPTEQCDETIEESVPGYCPGGTNIQCCVPRKCFFTDAADIFGTCITAGECEAVRGVTYEGICSSSTVPTTTCCYVAPGAGEDCIVPFEGGFLRRGECINTADCSAAMGMESVPDFCPGDQDIQCCVNRVAGCITADLAEGFCAPPIECQNIGFVTSTRDNYVPCVTSNFTECCIDPSPPPECTNEDGETGTCTTDLTCQRVGGTSGFDSFCDLNQVCCVPAGEPCPFGCSAPGSCPEPLEGFTCPNSLEGSICCPVFT